MIEDDIKPEIGDTVEYGTAKFDLNNILIAPAPRGMVVRVFKNGEIDVLPASGAPKTRLFPLEFTVLSKAG